MISKKLQAVFPGISARISALKRAWKAYLAYDKAIEGLNSIAWREPTNDWVQTVSERSPLSYEEAQYIYTVITEESDLYMGAENDMTEFVIDRASRGYRYYAIAEELADTNRELNAWMYNKLRMPP